MHFLHLGQMEMYNNYWWLRRQAPLLGTRHHEPEQAEQCSHLFPCSSGKACVQKTMLLKRAPGSQSTILGPGATFRSHNKRLGEELA